MSVGVINQGSRGEGILGYSMGPKSYDRRPYKKRTDLLISKI